TSPPDAPYLGMVKQQLTDAAQAANIPAIAIQPKAALEFIPQEEMMVARFQASAPPTAKAERRPEADNPALGNLSPAMVDQVKGMVAGLASKLEANPNDYNGWLMLGRSYTVLKDFDNASKAYEKAIALKPSEVDPHLQYLASLMTTVNPDDATPVPPKAVDA